jgi:hypothetical protein
MTALGGAGGATAPGVSPALRNSAIATPVMPGVAAPAATRTTGAREPVAAARYGLDDRLVAVADGLAHFGHAMCKHLIGHAYVQPESS